MKRNLFGADNRGVALLISLGIVAMFMLLAVDMGPMMAAQMRQSVSYYNYTRAYYAAESGLNAGLYELTHGGTKTSGEESFTYDENCPGTDDDGSGCAYKVTANWKIFKTTNKSYGTSGLFSYPIPGTGTAGSTCDPWYPVTSIDADETACGKLVPGQGQEWAKLKCSVTIDGGLGNILKKKKEISGVDTPMSDVFAAYTDAKDLPCNWNKIKYGETAQIPLYGENGELIFSEFKLRVRTPCKAVCDPSDGGDDKNCEVPELCKDGDRYVVKVEPFPDSLPPIDPARSIAKSKTAIKDVLIMWSIEDGTCGGVMCFLSNIVNVVNNDANYKKQARSLITAKRVNDKKDFGYCVLNETDTELSEGLKNADPSKLLNILNVVKQEKSFLHIDQSSTSFFKLYFAKQALSDEVPNKQIPYLEYQLLYKAGGVSVITSDPLITSESSVDGYKQSLQARYSPKTGVVNYVIQQ